MPLRIIRGDITQMEVDAIVNPTNGYFSGRGGTDGAIHRAAGPMLRLALASQDYLEVGNSIVTDAYLLPCNTSSILTGHAGEMAAPRILRFWKAAIGTLWSWQSKKVAVPLLSH